MNLPSRPISVIYELLADFPEEVAPRAVARLPFVQDAALRESIGRDVDSMEPLIRSEQWKAATVIGGSAIEAILLDALGGREAEARPVRPAAGARGPTSLADRAAAQVGSLAAHRCVQTPRHPG